LARTQTTPRTESAAGFGVRSVALIAAGLCALLVSGCAVEEQAAGPPAGAKTDKTVATAETGPISPSSAPGGYLAGLHAERLGDVTGAADFLKSALTRDPTNLDLMERSFLLTLSEGRVDEATAVAKKLSEHAPESALPALTLAVDEFKHGDFKGAEARLKALPDSGLNKFFVPLVMAWIREAEGDTDGAIAALDPLAQNSGFAVLRDMHAGLLNDVAGRNGAAEKNYKNALDGSQGGALRLIQALGSFYERTNKRDEAKKLYDDYLKENPDTILLDPELKRLADKSPAEPLARNATDGLAEALFNVASTLQQQGANLLALSYARLALALKPDFAVCQVLIADTFDGQGRTEEAVAIYRTVPKDSPFYWLGRMRIAIDLDGQGKTGEALAELDQMAAERPDRVDALITKGDILRAHDKHAEAVEAYTRAIDRIQKFEERHWAVLYARGIVYERLGQWAKAEADFLKALELRPDQPYVLNYLAYSWVEKGVNLDKAKKMLERAAELRPNDGFIVDSLGWILLSMGQTADAVDKLEQAVELEPQDPTINDHLGDAYWKAGRHTEAQFQWRRALALKPDAAATTKIEDKLKNGLSAIRVADPRS
jgi:tetratricopeptide (TPR) repeat protein